MKGKILVAYATKYGATEGIAAKIGEILGEEGLDVDLLSADKVDDLKPYEAVVVGSGVYIGRWRKEAAKFLSFTIVGALLFLCIKSYEWYGEIMAGYTITANTFWSFYYTAAGLHALHVIAGAIIMGVVAFDAFRGRELHRVEIIGIYWHFVDVVWIFLFPLLYIAK